MDENAEQNFKTCPEACSHTRSAKNLKYSFFRRIANPVCGVEPAIDVSRTSRCDPARPDSIPACGTTTGVACARAYESSYPASFRSTTDNNMYSRNAAARANRISRPQLLMNSSSRPGRNIKLERVSVAAPLYIDLPRMRCTHRGRTNEWAHKRERCISRKFSVVAKGNRHVVSGS